MTTTQTVRAPKNSLKERYKAQYRQHQIGERLKLANEMAKTDDQDLAAAIDLLTPARRAEIAAAFEDSATNHFPANSAEAQTLSTLAELLRAA
mgnify:CR=1 FL=1